MIVHRKQFLKSLLIACTCMSHTYSYADTKADESNVRQLTSNDHAHSGDMDETIFKVLIEYTTEGYRNFSKVDPKNFVKYDFTNAIAGSIERTDYNIGIIGSNYQRLTMEIDHVRQVPNQFQRYQIRGTSKVKNNLNDFEGLLTLNDIYIYADFDYGVDEEYKDKGLVEQGFAVFNYVLKENPNQKYSGVFTGKLYSKWYLTDDNVMHYNYINYYSDSYFNNLYYGKWSPYTSDKTKIAVWADYKLINEIVPDLNIGAGGFSPNPKYLQYGWADYHKQFQYNSD